MNRSRVTGDLTASGLLYADIANDRVGIGSTIPGNKLSLPDSAKIGLGNAEDLTLYHDSGHSYINNALGDLVLKTTNDDIILEAYDDINMYVQGASGSGAEKAIFAIGNGAVELYHNNTKRLYTTTSGAECAGYFKSTGGSGFGFIAEDSVKVSLGTGNDLNLYHSGSHSFIQNTTGSLISEGDSIVLRSTAQENYLVGTANGAVDLYWDGTKKFETYQYGVKSPGHIVASTDGYGFYAGAGFDIEMLHDGSDSRIKNITGDLEFQEHTSSGNIIFKTTTSGTERLRITSAGNVNQTIDADAIGFNQTAAGNHYIKNIVNANRTGANASILALHAHWNSKDVAAIKFRTGADTSNKDDGIICFETSSANNITERLRIDSSGRILAGTTSSSTNTRAIIQGRSDNANTTGTLHLQRGAANPNSNSGLGKIIFADNASAEGAYIWAQAAGQWASNDYPTRLTFATTADNTSSPTERLRITSGGDVLIGTTAAVTNTPLVVQGSGTTLLRVGNTDDGIAGITLNNTGSSNWSIRNEDAHLRFEVSNNEKLRITSAGKVGIGENTPLGNLHVKTADSGASVGASADELVLENSSNTGMTILSGTTGEGGINFGDSGDVNQGRVVYMHNGDYMHFHTNSAERLRITSGGVLCVGATAADSDEFLRVKNKLLVMNTANTGDAFVKIKAGESGGSVLEFEADEGDDYADLWRVQNAGDGLLGFRTKASGSWVQKLSVHNDKVMFSVDAKVDADNSRDLGASGARWRSLHLGTSARIGATGTTANTAGDDLVIEGSSDRGLSIISGTSSSANIYFGDSSDADIGRITYQHNDNALDFYTNAGSTALRIQSDGTVTVSYTHLRAHETDS